VTLFGLIILAGVPWLAARSGPPTIVPGEEFGVEEQVVFEKDLAASDAFALEQWQRRPLDLRV
jgi:hypothetical protein